MFELEKRENEVDRLEFAASQDSFWQDSNEERTSILKKIADIKAILERWEKVATLLQDAESAVELLEVEEDSELQTEVKNQLMEADKLIRIFELSHLLSDPQDKYDAILTVNSGAGGTESRDWAAMLLRMYRRWGEENNARVTVLDFQPGDEAGIKSATISLEGEYIYGKLKTEVGVHRLVRLSPFDTNKRRHTSFASIFVYPDIEDEIDIVVAESDIRVDTFRSSGAGGQHVNVTDSAIRITHKPTGIVVQCQNERSQHKNKATAMKILKAALYEREQELRRAEQDEIYSQKKEIAWGSQVRSYILHPYQMVKDHRTSHETSNTSAVLDGDLNSFIEATLSLNATSQ
ncbi:MAG: peptide chain release factor 2 [Proteobacteria bacterium]|nr:peptide chain release factor 2 [Pseudomonadota bacterium]